MCLDQALRQKFSGVFFRICNLVTLNCQNTSQDATDAKYAENLTILS